MFVRLCEIDTQISQLRDFSRCMTKCLITYWNGSQKRCIDVITMHMVIRMRTTTFSYYHLLVTVYAVPLVKIVNIPVVIYVYRFLFSLWLHGYFSCDQAALWMVQSDCLSACLSVRHTFFTMFPSSYHDAKLQGQRSKVKVTEVNNQFSRFRTVTPVWIHIWWWNDAQSLMLLRRGALLFFKVICHLSRSHG